MSTKEQFSQETVEHLPESSCPALRKEGKSMLVTACASDLGFMIGWMAMRSILGWLDLVL
jgi:hypothetical protein